MANPIWHTYGSVMGTMGDHGFLHPSMATCWRILSAFCKTEDEPIIGVFFLLHTTYHWGVSHAQPPSPWLQKLLWRFPKSSGVAPVIIQLCGMPHDEAIKTPVYQPKCSINHNKSSGWWFGCHQFFIFLHINIGFRVSSQVTKSIIFQDGVACPTTNQSSFLLVKPRFFCSWVLISEASLHP